MTALSKTHFDGSTPVLLSSSVSVNESNQAVPQMNDLSYPFRKALYIDEIRFTLASTAIGGNIGAAVYARFTLGQMYLMRDPVPIWLLSTFMSKLDEQEPESLDLSSKFYSHYRWRLPNPLYIEAGQFLLPTFSRIADGLGGSVNVSVTYAGRTVPPNVARPRIISLPYAAPFVTPANPSGNYAQSNEKHLFNPFDKPVQIQRMTGRLAFQDATAFDLESGLTPSVNGVQSLTVRISDSWGGKMANNYTGPGDVWDIQRCAWTFDTVMPAKGIYEVQAWNIPSTSFLHVGMIGSREETI